MNTQYLKKTILLAFFLLAVCIGSYAETIKILAIGNSFSQDAVENYLYELGQADGVTLVIGNMYIGGCSLDTHWKHANENNAAYEYIKIVDGVKTKTANTSLETAITDEAWDYISFQQLSSDAGRYSTYDPSLTNLLAYVKGKATNTAVQFMLHQTWAYQQNSTHSGFALYDKDQMKMYNAIVETVNQVAEEKDINIILPVGTAIQNARTSLLGDNMCRDGYHLDVGVGRYIAACTWYEKITGKNVVGNSFAPAMSGFRVQIAQNAAHAAVTKPSEVTDMTSDIELEIAAGDLNAIEFKPGHDGMSCSPLTFTEKDITVEFWLNIPAEKFNSGVTIMSARHDGAKGFSIDVSTDGRLRGFFRNDGGDKLNGRTDFVFPFFFAKEDIVDKWVHIAIVFSSTDNVSRSYLNGEVYEDLVKSTEPYTPYGIGWIGNHTSGLRVGYWYSDAAKMYGKIGDFRIWNTGRTDAEIKANYNKPLKGDEAGLYIYYNFNSFYQVIDNIVAPDRNPGNLQPAGTWDSCFTSEVLAGKPTNITFANETLTWDAEGESWEVEVISNIDQSVLKSETTTTNSLLLADLDKNAEFYVNIRTINNNFYSGWATSKVFPEESSKLNVAENMFTISVNNGALVINSDKDAILNLYAITGQLIRNINITNGKNVVSGIDKGVYLIDNQKVIIR